MTDLLMAPVLVLIAAILYAVKCAEGVAMMIEAGALNALIGG